MLEEELGRRIKHKVKPTSQPMSSRCSFAETETACDPEWKEYQYLRRSKSHHSKKHIISHCLCNE
jgi:hypothetical protein